jgi:hypothetical protein
LLPDRLEALLQVESHRYRIRGLDVHLAGHDASLVVLGMLEDVTLQAAAGSRTPELWIDDYTVHMEKGRIVAFEPPG